VPLASRRNLPHDAPMPDNQPDKAMMMAVERVARFIAHGDQSDLSTFAGAGVVIVENFAPHIFTGPDAVARWAQGMRHHTASLDSLEHSFGPAQDFGVTGDRAFFSLPTHWRGAKDGQRFGEDGGWAFVLERQAGQWRVLGYGWAVTHVGPE
jgi:hypothetical protein